VRGLAQPLDWIATKQKRTVIETELPLLLLLIPTASADIREGFGATQTETTGVYHLPKWERTVLVVLHQLPKTRDTLWLRLLARAGEQQRAIAEFAELPTEEPLYASISDLLANYRAILEARGQLTPEDEELIMNLSTAYLKKQEEWKLEGKLEEKLEVARNLLREGTDVELIAKVTGLAIAAQIKFCHNAVPHH
jgi:alkylated DNA nucleotide flippase Atl1